VLVQTKLGITVISFNNFTPSGIWGHDQRWKATLKSLQVSQNLK